MDLPLEGLDQEQRIKRLRDELEKLGGSTMSFEAMPADMEEEFLRHVLEYETAQPISLYKILENSGVGIPNPTDLGEEVISAKLNEKSKRTSIGCACWRSRSYNSKWLGNFTESYNKDVQSNPRFKSDCQVLSG